MKPVLLPCPSAFPGILLLIRVATWPHACAWQSPGDKKNQKTPKSPVIYSHGDGNTSSSPGGWWRLTAPALEWTGLSLMSGLPFGTFRVFSLSEWKIALHL